MTTPTDYTGPVYSYIRFSSTKQAQGDSVRRQSETAEKWCKERGLTLDSTLSDSGISGFTGKNVSHGALGKFLEAIKLGLVTKGSTLLVENLDRLSRDEIFSALGVFTEIVTSGVRIVSMMDGQIYTAENIKANPYQLMYTIGAFVRGHEESQTKSRRLREVFATKRKELHNKKWRNKCPPWLKFNEDKTGFVILEDKADIIRRLYNEYASGVGVSTIARKFQAEKVGRLTDNKPLWQTSTVQYYLKTRTVIGEYQPQERRGKGRVPAGEPIKDYYPAIVETNLFERVYRMLTTNKKVRGRQPEGLSNIFRGVLYCPYCGSTMLLRRNLTTGGNRSETYVCDKAHRLQTCVGYGWDREDLENTFLEFAQEVHDEYMNVQAYKPDNTGELPKINDRLKSVEDEETRMLELYKKGRVANISKIEDMLNKLQEERAALAKRKLELENISTGRAEKQFKFDLDMFINTDLTDPQKREIIAGAISRLFKRIDVYYVGLPSRHEHIKQLIAKMEKQGLKRNQIYFKLVKETPFMQERFFVGVFNAVGAKPYPAELADAEFAELYEYNKPPGSNPEAEFKAIIKKYGS